MTELYKDTTYLESKPYALIFWTLRGELEPSIKTVCYSPEEIVNALDRHMQPQDMYSKYMPSIHLAESL